MLIYLLRTHLCCIKVASLPCKCFYHISVNPYNDFSSYRLYGIIWFSQLFSISSPIIVQHHNFYYCFFNNTFCFRQLLLLEHYINSFLKGTTHHILLYVSLFILVSMFNEFLINLNKQCHFLVHYVLGSQLFTAS